MFRTAQARSDGLDALRGIAIALVLGYHHVHVDIGWAGPDLFCALSGFLLGGILIDQRHAPGYWRAF